MNVKNGCIGPLMLEDFKRFLHFADRGEDIITSLFQNRPQVCGKEILVLDNEDTFVAG